MAEWIETGSRRDHIWSIQMPSIRIVIVRGHLDEPDSWVMHCPQLNINTKVMGHKDRSSSSIKHHALAYVNAKLRRMMEDIEMALKDQPESDT